MEGDSGSGIRAVSRMVVNFGIYIFPFLLFHFWHYHTLPFVKWQHYTFFWIYTWAWFIPAIISRKALGDGNYFFPYRLFPVFVAFIMMVGLFSVFHVHFFSQFYSRSVFFLAVCTGFLIEVAGVISSVGPAAYVQTNIEKYSWKEFRREFLILLLTVVVMLVVNRGSMDCSFRCSWKIVVVFLAWLIAGLLASQFYEKEKGTDVWRVFWRAFKHAVFFFLLISFVTFYLPFSQADLHVLLMGVISYSFATIILNPFQYFSTRPRSTDIVEPRLLRAHIGDEEFPQGIFTQPDEKYVFPLRAGHSIFSFSEKLKTIYLARYPSVYDYLHKTIHLDEVDINRAIAVRTNDLYNVDILPDEYINFFCNLLELNHIRRINEYLIAVNAKLAYGGLLIGVLEPAHQRFIRFMTTYPYYLARVFYLLDFLWKRVSPKLPVLKTIYFTLTKGRNRVISLAEGLGRLYYCGFEVVSIKEINGLTYFIAKKTGEPKTDKNPSYGPLFKMRRIGKEGKKILVYKLRTMHPYSEYLQKFIFEHNQLQEGGKINKDFRITSWGKVMRKLWIDELPMLINWVKGDLKLIGVRPLSAHYLSLYTHELQEKRKLVKPGLFPPFYADMPKTLDEIMSSELKYINKYLESPLKTDAEYFLRIVTNIIVKKARSK